MARMSTAKTTIALTPEELRNGASSTGEAPGYDDIWGMVRPVEELEHLDKLKLLLFGPTGSGKSEFAAGFERPLIGLTEKQAIPVIKRRNPNAMVFLIEDGQSYNSFRKLIQDPRLPERCDAVVLDSLTDVQRIIKDGYINVQNRSRPPEKQRDVADVDTWQLIIDRTGRTARELRDLPVHTCVICLDDEHDIEGIGTLHRPAVSGKRLPNELGQYFNIVGYSYKIQRKNGIRHEVLLNGPDNYKTKGRRDLDDIECPEPQVWLNKIYGIPISDAVKTRADAWRVKDQQQNTQDQKKQQEKTTTTKASTEVDPFNQ